LVRAQYRPFRGVAGTDRTRVEGLTQRLAEVLAPRTKLGYAVTTSGWWVPALFIGGMLVFTAVLVVLRAAFGADEGLSVGVAAFAAVVATALAIVMTVVSPRVEFLPPAGQPRYQRWRGNVLAGFAAAILSIATSLVATVIYSG
jgi:hypothetical protein